MNKNNVPSARRSQEPDPDRQLSEFTAQFVPVYAGGALEISPKCFADRHKECNLVGVVKEMLISCKCECHKGEGNG